MFIYLLFIYCFIKKISDIHLKLDKMTEELPTCDPVSLAYDCESVVTMQTFSQLTESNVRDLVLSSAKKTCMLDPMPTLLVVTCLDVLLPVLTKIIYTSLTHCSPRRPKAPARKAPHERPCRPKPPEKAHESKRALVLPPLNFLSCFVVIDTKKVN